MTLEEQRRAEAALYGPPPLPEYLRLYCEQLQKEMEEDGFALAEALIRARRTVADFYNALSPPPHPTPNPEE